VKRELTWQGRGTKRQCVFERNRTHDLPNTWRAIYPLSYKNPWEQGHFTEFICERRPAFCPMLESCWLIHLSHFITKLKNSPSLFTYTFLESLPECSLSSTVNTITQSALWAKLVNTNGEWRHVRSSWLFSSLSYVHNFDFDLNASSCMPPKYQIRIRMNDNLNDLVNAWA